MTTLIVVVCGFTAGCGLLLIALGLVGTSTPPPGQEALDEDVGAPVPPPAGGLPAAGRGRARTITVKTRLMMAAAAGVALWLLTGWPVGILLAMLAGYMAPSLIGAKARRQAEVELTESIATWAEQLRDVIGAAAGLQEAVATTARVAPLPIRPAVADLAAGMRRNSLSVELQRFADRLADPIADQVAVALLLASERRGDDLGRLLNDLAEGARADATMRIRTETARARTYNDAKVVTGVVVGMFLFLLIGNRSYLQAFDTVAGQLVLAVIGALWLLALHGINTLSEVRRPPRLLNPGARTGPRRAVT